MQNIKNHKILSIFNLAAVLLIVVGVSTDFTVPDSGTSISGGIAAWGALLLIVMLIVDGVVAVKHSKKNQKVQQSTLSPQQLNQQTKLARAKGVSMVAGSILGLVVTYLLLADQGPEAGLIFLPLAAVFAPLGAFILYTLTKIAYGDASQKKSAFKWFILVALLIAAYLGYGYYQDEYGQKYCDGQPIEQYQGELPDYCLNQ